MVDDIPNELGKATDTDVQNELIDIQDVSTMTLVTIGILTGFFFFLILCVIILLIKRRLKKRRSLDNFLHEISEDISTCKSAPISRCTSPEMKKRGSCPNAYGTIEESIRRSVDPIPQLHLTSEHVQPRSQHSKSTSSIEYQNVFLTAIQTNVDTSESDTSKYGQSAPTTPSIQGRVWFTVMYDVIVQQLFVTLVKVTELPGRGVENTTRDPFVKVFLLPDEQTCRNSKSMKKTLNPVFNETFMFQVKEKDVNSRSIRFSVYDVDRRRIRHSLGHVVFPLCDVDMRSSAILWKDVESVIQNCASIGDINIGLTYLPQLEKMKVIIFRARNLKIKTDPDKGLYVNVQYSYGNKFSKTKQTLTKRAGPETSFNESFSFSTSSKNIDNFNFTLKLMQTSRSSPSEDNIEVGHVNLGSFMFARGAGLLHWQEMLSKTRSIVTKWHLLSI